MSSNNSLGTPRARATHDFYGPIHKGLRLAEARLLMRLGTTDYGNPETVSALVPELRTQIKAYAAHLAHEDEYVHTAWEARAPGGPANLARRHKEHRDTFTQLTALIDRLEAAAPQERPSIGRELYLRFSQFVAHDLEHMAEEELVVLPQLQELFTNAELQTIERDITAATPPDLAMFNANIMTAALNQDERVALLSSFKSVAPPEAFQAVLHSVVRPNLTDAEWSNLTSRLGLPA